MEFWVILSAMRWIEMTSLTSEFTHGQAWTQSHKCFWAVTQILNSSPGLWVEHFGVISHFSPHTNSKKTCFLCEFPDQAYRSVISDNIRSSNVEESFGYFYYWLRYSLLDIREEIKFYPFYLKLVPKPEHQLWIQENIKH